LSVADQTEAPPRTLTRSEVVAVVLTYGLLIAYGVTLYVMILAAGSAASGGDRPTWLYVVGTVAVVATVEPVRRWLRVAVEDLIHGHHENPYDVIVSLRRELGDELPPEAPLAATIARAVNLPYVAIEVPGQPLRSHGVLVAGTTPFEVPLVFRGEQLGTLAAGPRRRGLQPSSADLRLLRDLADQVAVTIMAQRAAAEVLESRARLVTAREEERRRIRRDLHDGMGPTLAAMQLQLKAVQRLLPGDPDRAGEIVGDLLGDVRATTADIRRLVYDLRPPMLDDLGLVGALHSQRPLDGPDLRVEADADMQPLPAAVEVALYRIAAEAIQNAAKHAAARTVRVHVTTDGTDAQMTIVDDGRGLPAGLIEGVGLAAMRERADELGGQVAIRDEAPSGTRVVARIPLRGANRE